MTTSAHSGSLVKLLPPHWMDAQRLLVGLSLMDLTDNQSRRESIAERALSFLHAPSELFYETGGIANTDAYEDYRRRIEALQPSTLRRLCNVSVDRLSKKWRAHFQIWGDVGEELRQAIGLSGFAGAKLLANRIISSDQSIAQIAKLANQEFKVTWDLTKDQTRLFAHFLKTVRASGERLENRLKALQQFTQEVRLSRWEMIENAILHQWFSWPIIVLEPPNNLDRPPRGISLPVAVEVSLSESLDSFVEDGLFKNGEWLNSLKVATHAARELWKKKHLSCPPLLLKDIESLSASINLSVAEAVYGPYIEWGYTDLTGPSADLHLALTILGNLVAPQAMENVCATGILGERIPDLEGGENRMIEMPGELECKFNYALSTHLIDTMLVPDPSPQVTSVAHLLVKKGHTLEEFCEHAFAQKWRKHQYVRAPDLAIAYRPDQPSERYTKKGVDPEVDEIIDKLRRNQTSAILHLEDTAPNKVAKALYWINNEVSGGKQHKKGNRVGKKFMGSYAFMRVVPDTINERMWLPVWDMIRGTPETFFEFQFSSHPRSAATILAKELNKLSPRKDDLRRAPDVLVIVYTDTEGHFFSRSGIAGEPFSRLKLESLVPTLNKLLIATPVPFLKDYLGATRVILVRDSLLLPDGVAVFPRSALTDLDANKIDAIEKLSVFRYGFTLNMASRLLGVSENECNQLLGSLNKNVQIGDERTVLIYSKGCGEFLLKVRIEAAPDDTGTSNMHYQAANAILGFLNPTEDVFRFSFNEAFESRWLQEAQWHLWKAFKLAPDKNKRADYLREHERLSGIAEVFGFTRVRWATRPSSGDGAELGDAIEEHIGKIQSRGFFRYGHPLDFMWAAEYTGKLAVSKNTLPATKDKFRKLRDKYLRLSYDRILGDKSFSDAEKRASWYVFGTTKACLLLKERPNVDGLSAAREAIDIAQRHGEYERELLDWSWFEFMGDSQRDPLKAIRWYERGIFNAEIPKLRPNLSIALKYLGAVFEAGRVRPRGEILNALTELRGRSNLSGTPPVGGLDQLGYVRRRWENGRKLFTDKRIDLREHFTRRTGTGGAKKLHKVGRRVAVGGPATLKSE